MNWNDAAMQAPLTFLDIGLLAIMVISGVLALMRGFTREVLSIASWTVAAGASVFAYLRFRDMVRAEIRPDYLADAVLIGGTFLITLIIVSFITAKISDAILDSRTGALDRTLGFVFGLARGLVIVVIAFLFFNWLVPEQNQPTWVKDARSRDVLNQVGRTIMSYLPDDPEQALSRLRRNRDQPSDAPADQAPPRPATPAPGTPAPGQRSDAPSVPTMSRSG